ncbi:hypothetical protein [Cohnella rhizosphaerae]|uniref:Uncharacterized protein n=1 Tax=Cohnella rhizosphaerae TaxID=1457232 RepID=A0A9X4L249_9BACL|nr:hypothetical protein [Cohnella rhizosphaerae]MDG0812137.1 hypothetical protein [Cohnella rhizosphaerae]
MLVQAGIRTGQGDESAVPAVSMPLQKINEALEPMGNRAGALTDEDRIRLTSIATSADRLAAILKDYTPPTGNDRFRQMQAGVDWVPVVQRFINELNDSAASIQ